MISTTKNISMKNSIVVKIFNSEIILTIQRTLIKPNMKLTALTFLLLFPVFGFAKIPAKNSQKAKVTKTIKRNIFDIEFGTFNFNSPVLSKKSVFLG